MDDKTRAHAVISGRVQGVCFRLETRTAADKYGVSGWVRNLADGTVEAVFEGNRKDVDLALEWCLQGPAMSKVTNVEVQREEFTGDFKGFEITY